VHATSNTAHRRVFPRLRAQRLLVSIATLGAVIAGTRPAFCTEVTDFIRGDGSCPAPHAVEAEVFRLTSPEGRAVHLPGAQVRVFDEGDGYGVEIQKGGETYRKTYDDPGRTCDQRARVVAVTVVMTLIPAELSSEASGEAALEPAGSEPARAAAAADAAEPGSEGRTPRAAAPSPASAEAVTEESRATPPGAPVSVDDAGGFELEVAGWFQHSISSSEVPRIAVWGGELLATLGTARVAGLVAVSGGGSSSFDLGDIRASLFEVSARAGARALWPLGGVTLGFDAAFVGARRQVSAEGERASDAQPAWELGGSLGANVRFDVSRRLAPVAGVRLNVFPAPSELEAAPRGVIGTLPKFWLGVHAGVRFDL